MIAICCVTDDKPGHKSQIDGLLEAMAEHTEIHTEWLHVNDPTPVNGSVDLILAAGHKTHTHALKLKWKCGAKLVVLMKPSLPLWLFDLCLIPEHDGIKPGKRVFNTIGAINPIRPSGESSPKEGLILIGGPSKHFAWSDEKLIEQLEQLRLCLPEVHWNLTTSRRTPNSFFSKVTHITNEQLIITPLEQTNRDWLLHKFRHCGVIWVTEDSVSMIYESLSSGARVGVLEVPELKPNRISRSIKALIQKQQLSTLANLKTSAGPPTAVHMPLNEADRAARYVIQWLGLPVGI